MYNVYSTNLTCITWYNVEKYKKDKKGSKCCETNNAKKVITMKT